MFFFNIYVKRQQKKNMSTHCTEQRNSCLYKRHKQIVFHIKQGRCLQSYEHQFTTL